MRSVSIGRRRVSIDVGTVYRKTSKLLAVVVVISGLSALDKCKDIPVIPPTVNKIIISKKKKKKTNSHGRNVMAETVRCPAAFRRAVRDVTPFVKISVTVALFSRSIFSRFTGFKIWYFLKFNWIFFGFLFLISCLRLRKPTICYHSNLSSNTFYYISCFNIIHTHTQYVLHSQVVLPSRDAFYQIPSYPENVIVLIWIFFYNVVDYILISVKNILRYCRVLSLYNHGTNLWNRYSRIDYYNNFLFSISFQRFF